MINKFKKCLWLIKTIYTTPMSYEEINDKWQKSPLNIEGGSFPKKTLHNHLLSIQEMFGIDITCDRRDDYRYKLDPDSAQEKITTDLLCNLFLKMSINDNASLGKKFYDMELNSFFPKFYYKLVDVIENQFVISFLWGDNFDIDALKKEYPNCSIDFTTIPTRHNVDYFKPLGMVKVDNVWYLIGKSRSKTIHIFDANKIIEYKVVGKDEDKNDMDFDAENYALTYKEPAKSINEAKEYYDNEFLFSLALKSTIFRKDQYDKDYTFEEWNNK